MELSGPHSQSPGQSDLLHMLIASLGDKSNANEINSNLGQNVTCGLGNSSMETDQGRGSGVSVKQTMRSV